MSLETTFTAPAGKPRKAAATVDAVIEAAVEIAREAALEVAGPDEVGEHEGMTVEGQRLATHYFAAHTPGYRGWRWAVTLSRAPRAKTPTVCEVSMLAGGEAITAPAWVPWSERLQPGDVGRNDVLPYSPDDSRLMQGYEATGEEDADHLAIYELGLGRPRVLSPEGRHEAATRWYSGEHGPVELADRRSTKRGAAKAQCSTCGFLMLMAGSMRTVFGVCANEWSPDDGQVVSMDHGCGAHSETDVIDARRDWPENAPIIDEHAVEYFDHGAEREQQPAAQDAAPEAEADDDRAGEESDSAAAGGSEEPGDPDEHEPHPHEAAAEQPASEEPAPEQPASEEPAADAAQDENRES